MINVNKFIKDVINWCIHNAEYDAENLPDDVVLSEIVDNPEEEGIIKWYYDEYNKIPTIKECYEEYEELPDCISIVDHTNEVYDVYYKYKNGDAFVIGNDVGIIMPRSGENIDYDLDKKYRLSQFIDELNLKFHLSLNIKNYT